MRGRSNDGHSSGRNWCFDAGSLVDPNVFEEISIPSLPEGSFFGQRGREKDIKQR